MGRLVESMRTEASSGGKLRKGLLQAVKASKNRNAVAMVRHRFIFSTRLETTKLKQNVETIKKW
jgi:hypothetical protein